jgi:iron complex outermembrane receptor protein
MHIRRTEIRSSTSRLALRSAAAVALGLQAMLPLHAFAQELEETTVLKRIVVKDGDDDAAAKAADNDTIVPEANESALKSDTPLVKTPRSVAVVTRTEIEDRAVTDMIEAVRYAAAVSTGQYGFDPRFDQITIRGFSTVTTGDFRDGLRQPYMNYATYRTETYGLDRVEVIKGPVSVLYGSSSAAGIVNRVSKFADGLDHGEAELQYGSYGRTQLGLDYGAVSKENDAFSYRVVGVARQGNTSYNIADDRLMLQPSFQWAPDDGTSLTVYAIAHKDETDVNVQTIMNDGEILRYSDPAYDYQKVEQFQTGYKFEHEFENGLKFKQHVRYSYLDLWGRYLEVSAVDEATNIMSRYPVALTDHQDVFQADNRLEGTFDTGPVSHKLIGGLDYTFIKSSFGLGMGDPNPIFDLDLNNPTTGRDGSTPDITSLTSLDQIQTGLYAQDQMTYENWTAIFGLRHDWVHQAAFDDTAGVKTGSKDDGAFSYQGGLLYHFDNGLSPYVNYATSFVPQAQLDENGAMLGPMTGEQFEAGIKFQPDGADYSLSAAYYHLIQSNAAKYAGMNDTVGYFYRAIGEVTSDGFEIEARKKFVNGISVIAAYNYNDAVITKSVTASEVGNQPSTTPFHTASLWMNYEVPEDAALDGLSGGLGVRYNSGSFKDDGNTTRNKQQVYLDAALSFDIGKQNPQLDGLQASFGIKNILDKRVEVCTDGFCYFGQGRTVVGSLKYSW